MDARSRKITALLVTGALLTGIGVSQVAQRLSFKDIPAGHWATSAVQYIAQTGLVTGFADNSFRGQQNLTRYEAATIFYRLLRSNALKNVDEEGRTLIAKGIGEVKVEMDRARTNFAQLEQSDAGQAARLNALEAQLRNLSRAPATGNAQTVSAIGVLEARLKTLEDRAVTSNQQEARLTTLETRVSAFGVVERRVGGLEAQMDTLGKRFGDTSSDHGARLRSLESDAQTSTAQTKGLDARLSTLETRINALDARPAPTPPTATPSPAPSSVTVGAPVVTLTGPTESAGFYIGASLAYPLYPSPMFDLTRSSYSAMIGVRRLVNLGFTNLGARVSLDYMPVGGSFTINPALTFSGGGALSPYLGAGFGVTLGTAGTDVFVNALAGVDVNVLSWAALFAELDPRYSFGANGFSLNTRVGFKIKF